MANAVLLEARSYRPFKSSEEYLYAMREDLAEWLNVLYPELLINTDNFMDRLDTGVALCKVSSVLFFYCIRLTKGLTVRAAIHSSCSGFTKRPNQFTDNLCAVHIGTERSVSLERFGLVYH